MNNDFMLRGFDASSWNGEIDWEKAAGNFDFVLLRAGFGSAVDSLFKENLHGAKEADMLCGAYLESLAENTSDAQDEGRALLEVLNGEELDFPVGVRCENGFKKDVIVYLCGMLSDVGYTPLIGCTAEQAEIFEDSGYDLWLLDGRQGDSAAVVQYAEDEQIEGASIGVNLDYAYKDFSKGNSQYEDEYFWYTVKPGDTLWTIALKFNTDYEKIAKLNGLGSPYLLDIGQMLKIPAMKNCEMPGFTCYKVKSGDSLWSIGQKFGVSWRKIAVINKIANPSNLQPGTVLSIPTDGNLAPSQQVNTLDVGDHVRIKSDAMYYYAGRRIPDWVKTDYTYYVAAVLYNGKPVYLGDKRSVLLGKRQNNMTGVIEPGFNTWVNEDILEKV